MAEQTVPTSGPAAPDPLVVAASLHAALSTRSAMMATAESLTGGGLGDLLSAAPGASETYLGGVVCYATRVKQELLGVSDRTVAEHGVVSAECAREMALGVRALLGADFAVSTTGVAGPTEQEGKRVGLVFVGVAGPWGVTALRLELSGDRAEVRQKTCLEAVTAALRGVTGGPRLDTERSDDVAGQFDGQFDGQVVRDQVDGEVVRDQVDGEDSEERGPVRDAPSDVPVREVSEGG